MTVFARTPIAVALVTLGLGFGNLARAQDASAKIIDYGRYRQRLASVSPTEQETSGAATVQADAVTHIETTKRIPCKIGEVFGFRVEYANLPKGRDYELRTEVFHPAIKQPNGEVLSRSVVKTTLKAGTRPDGTHTWSFLNGFEYELVRGVWTFTIYLDGREVASKNFDVE